MRPCPIDRASVSIGTYIGVKRKKRSRYVEWYLLSEKRHRDLSRPRRVGVAIGLPGRKKPARKMRKMASFFSFVDRRRLDPAELPAAQRESVPELADDGADGLVGLLDAGAVRSAQPGARLAHAVAVDVELLERSRCRPASATAAAGSHIFTLLLYR